MSDPRQSQQETPAEEPAAATSATTASTLDLAPAARNRLQRGGLRGCFDGRQSLAFTFWVLGVGVTLLVMLAGKLLAQVAPIDAFGAVTLGTAIALGAARIVAWYAIVKCRRNTDSEIFTALALVVITLDVVFGILRWPSLLLRMTLA